MKKMLLLVIALMAFNTIRPVSRAFADAAAPAPAAAPAATPAAGPEVEGPKDTAEPAHGTSLIAIITRAGWFGELVWAALLGCLIVCVTLVVDCYITITEKSISPQAVVDSVRTAIREGDLYKAMGICEQNPGPLARILTAGFRNAEEGFEVVQDSVSVAGDIESEKLMTKVTYLSVISNTTPMLGLIGTVQGMIFAFQTLGTKAAGAAQQAMLALNISHGLWATAVGLCTAVPATIFFYFFKGRASKIILGMEALTLDVIKSLRNVEIVET